MTIAFLLHLFRIFVIMLLTYSLFLHGLSAVMETDGFEYLKQSCPSVLTDLLQYVASEHHSTICRHGNATILDGGDINGRRVKQRL